MLGLLPGVRILIKSDQLLILELWISSRQNQLFGCNCGKIDVGQLRTSGELEASAGIFFFPQDLIT